MSDWRKDYKGFIDKNVQNSKDGEKNKSLLENEDHYKFEVGGEGRVDYPLFCSLPYKILFIGHEPYEQGNPFSTYINAIESYGDYPRKMYFKFMNLVAKEILNLPNEKGNLNKIAAINVKKSPRKGETEEKSAEIELACAYNIDYIFEQINTIAPDIVVGANVFDGHKLWNPWCSFRNCLEFIDVKKTLGQQYNAFFKDVFDYVDFYKEVKTGLLMVDSIHPSFIGVCNQLDSLSKFIGTVVLRCKGEPKTIVTTRDWTRRQDRISNKQCQNY